MGHTYVQAFGYSNNKVSNIGVDDGVEENPYGGPDFPSRNSSSCSAMFVRACTDHSTWMCSLFESLRFRAHLHNLLYDYVKKHCTVDYLTFTEDLVSEVSFSLEAPGSG